MRLRVGLLGAGGIALVAAVSVSPAAAIDSAGRTWPPFVLVVGLLLIGLIANEDGIFASAAALLERLPGSDLLLFLAAMGLVAAVTTLLNLDTSAAFLTPVLVLAARRRGADGDRFMYGCVYMSNTASLLLPGSNLTNLLVLNGEHINGWVFAARMLKPWIAGVVVTTVVVAVAFRKGRSSSRTAADHTTCLGATETLRGPRVGRASADGRRRPHPSSILPIAAALALLLTLTDPALPVLGVGVAVAGIRFAQGRVSMARLREAVDLVSLTGVFMVAVSLGVVARVWSYPGLFVSGAGEVATAVVAAGLSIVVNNLPAAVLLGSPMPAHPRALLLGLNLGPNLAVTGSLSALIWWHAARSVGARPSALRYSAVGVVLVPLTLAAALAATHLPG